MSKSNAPVVVSSPDWDTSAVRYMQPKVNERGGKSIQIISTQSGRSLHVSTPLLMTWGIADFVDDKGESDGKFSMTLNFPNNDYKKPGTDMFLEKLKNFEDQILDDAVKYSEAWFGDSLSRDVVKHSFFPFLKYQKDKLTKKLDLSKPPSIKARVPNYNNKWSVQIYDTAQQLIFPSENENLTPMDFVPRLSNVACVLQCGGLWFGGKGWGCTWKVAQIVVKPREVVSVYDKCHITLSTEEMRDIGKEPVDDEASVEATPVAVDTTVDDSEEEEEEEEVEEEPEPTPPVATFSKKKVVKKVEEEVAAVAAAAAADAPIKKKVVRKKAVAAAAA